MGVSESCDTIERVSTHQGNYLLSLLFLPAVFFLHRYFLPGVSLCFQSSGECNLSFTFSVILILLS